jgi:glycosyltransferase involved in cell wall biosynthesis
MSPHRIAMVSFSPLAIGGIETHLLQIFRGLAREFEFTVIGTVQEPFIAHAQEYGVTCVPLPAAGKASPTALLRLRKEFLARGIELVHTHDTRGGLIGRLAAGAAGMIAMHTVHTPSFFLPRNPAKVFLYRQAERALNALASDKVIFVSRTILEMYLAGGLVSWKKSCCIPNGLEREWFLPAERHTEREGLRFLYVGRLAREKGIDTLASAFGRISARLPYARLQVAGEGPEGEGLACKAEAEGWRARLDLLGALSREQVRGTMLGADVFVLPSSFESFSYTLLEAMACGLPCIAADTGGNRDLVDPDRTGFLVRREDPAALADAMIRLAGDPEMRAALGREGAVRAREYTLERMIERTGALYREFLAPPSPFPIDKNGHR